MFHFWWNGTSNKCNLHTNGTNLINLEANCILTHDTNILNTFGIFSVTNLSRSRYFPQIFLFQTSLDEILSSCFYLISFLQPRIECRKFHQFRIIISVFYPYLLGLNRKENLLTWYFAKYLHRTCRTDQVQLAAVSSCFIFFVRDSWGLVILNS